MAGKSTPYRTCSGKPKPQFCPYCGQQAAFHVNSAKFYHGKNFGPIYVCEDCDARVGCHPGSHTALGALANKETRLARNAAHKAFDVLWKIKWKRTGDSGSRGKAYGWLAEQLGLTRAECHIGMFDVATCRRVVEICNPVLDRIRRAERMAA